MQVPLAQPGEPASQHQHPKLVANEDAQRHDDDHRLHAAKLLGILNKAAKLVFPDNADELSVDLEYEDCTLSQYPVDSYEVRDGAVVLLLTKKHTDCLAKDKCMVPAAAGAPAVSSCCGGKC